MQELSAVIAELKQRLDESFVTVNTVTGDAGIKKAQVNYEKLMKINHQKAQDSRKSSIFAKKRKIWMIST